jgi:hypothetical protein
MRKLWTDPDFLARIEKMQASSNGSAPVNGAPVEFAGESSASSPRELNRAEALTEAGSAGAPFASSSPSGNGAGGKGESGKGGTGEPAKPGAPQIEEAQIYFDTPAPQGDVEQVFADRKKALAGGVSKPRDQLLAEQRALQKKLDKPQDYPGRDKDEGRMQEINQELEAYGDTVPVAAGGAGGSPPQDPPPPGGKGGAAGGGAGGAGAGGDNQRGKPTGPGKDAPPQGGGRGGDTVATSNPGSVAPRNPNERVPGDTRKVVFQPRPPDNGEVTIRTAKGPEKMTAQEYRARVSKAEAWVLKQQMAYQGQPGAVKGRSPPGLSYDQAADQFGLDRGWQNPLNPIRYGRDVIVDGPKSPGSPSQDPSKGGGSGGESGPGQGGKGPGEKPAEAAAGVSEAAKQAAQKVDDYIAHAQTLQQNRDNTKKLQSDLEAMKKQGKASPADVAKAEKTLADEKAAVANEAQRLESEGVELSREVRSLPPERLPATSEYMKRMTSKLGTALTLVQSTLYIFSATSPADAMKRTAEVEGGLVVAAVAEALVGSAAAATGAMFVLDMASDQGTRYPTPEERNQAYVKAMEDEDNRMINRATAKYIEKVKPGSVQWEGDDPVQFTDKELYNSTVGMIKDAWEQKKQQEDFPVWLNSKKIHAQVLGARDGMAGEREHKFAGHDVESDHALPAGWESYAGMPLVKDMDATFASAKKEIEAAYESAYESAFKAGEAAAGPALQRARALGAADAKARIPMRQEQVQQWPEYRHVGRKLELAYQAGYAAD